MILDQQDERIIARNEQEIKEYFEFKLDLENKIVCLRKQNRELKERSDIHGSDLRE